MDRATADRDVAARRGDLERAEKKLSEAQRRGAPQTERYFLSEDVRSLGEALDRSEAARDRTR